MTFVNVNNPFVQAASPTYLFLFLIKVCLFYPLLFWGCYRHVARQRIPVSFYVVLGAIFIFWQPNLFLNDLVTICLAIMAVFYLANPFGDRLTTIVSQFGYSILVYYFASTVCMLLSRIILVKYPQFGSLLYLFLVPIIYGLALLVIRIVRPISNRYLARVNNRHPIAEWCLSLLFIPLSLFFFFVQYNQPAFNQLLGVNNLTGNSAALLIALSYFVLAILIMNHIGKDLYQRDLATFATQQLNSFANYTSELEVMYDDLRRFRHDYKNILISLNSALDDNNIEYAKQSLHQLTQSSNRIIDLPTGVLGALQNITNSGIKSIVYQKISVAIKAHLHPRLEVVRPIDLTKTLQSLDAIRIIAILLDNAIAAAKNSTQKEISLSLFENDNAQFIIVGNSTKESQVDLELLAKIEHSVSINSSHHLGLRNLKIILGHYPNAVNDRSSDHHWLEQKIVLPKN